MLVVYSRCPEMLDIVSIEQRLREMASEPDPVVRWDETCEGSARSLAIFVGPSPGGQKPPQRRPMNKGCFRALWNESFDKPFANPSSWWSPGFRISFKPLVEALFDLPFEVAGKLIGRANMDWISDPQSKEVDRQNMLEGCPSVMRMIQDCIPDLVLPMDHKTFGVLRYFLETIGFSIAEHDIPDFTVVISETPRRRVHRRLHAFHARNGKGLCFWVMKLPQHPARIFRADYGARCGSALRNATVGAHAQNANLRPKTFHDGGGEV